MEIFFALIFIGVGGLFLRFTRELPDGIAWLGSVVFSALLAGYLYLLRKRNPSIEPVVKATQTKTSQNGQQVLVESYQEKSESVKA